MSRKECLNIFSYKIPPRRRNLKSNPIPTPALPGSGTVDSITQSPLSQVNLAPTNTLRLKYILSNNYFIHFISLNPFSNKKELANLK